MLASETRDVLWVLEDAGRIVGCLGLHGTRRADVAALGMAIVAGRGGGHALVRAALVHGRAERMSRVELEVLPDNRAAIALYEAHGFAVEGERRERYGRRDGSVRGTLRMALELE